MAASASNRLRIGIVLVTLVICAFFTARGAMALLSARVVQSDPTAPTSRSKTRITPGQTRLRHDADVILRRNIFDSALGDLTAVEIEEAAMPDAEMPEGGVQVSCNNELRLIGTVVVPGELEQSLAAIVGTDNKAGLHRGGEDVEGSRIRAIWPDAVVLQVDGGFCRLTMFEVGSEDKPRAVAAAPPPARAEPAKRGRPEADRNAGLSDAEISEGIERVNDTNYNISRAMMNKVLDNAGKLIGIAAVRPKIENGESVGMEIRGVRPDTLLTKLGIQNGDILESVNGQSLTSTDAALGAYTALRTSDKFSLSIRRGGKSMIVDYNLQ